MKPEEIIKEMESIKEAFNELGYRVKALQGSVIKHVENKVKK